MLRLKHILSILFLVMATSVLAQETYVIDSVCVGAERTYRRDGEAGYTYDWYIRDTLGTNVANPSGIDFSEVITPGDTTWGSEITYQWIDTGIFDIVVEVYTEHSCDTLEQGRVKVYPEPEVEVGEDQTVCALENIIVSGDAARNYSVMFWETSGDGSFSDDEQLHPTYYLGPNDSLAGSVTLTITAWGKADNITCEPAIDSITYFFSNPEIELVVDDLLCFGDSTASVTATVTNGISPYNYSWTDPDGFTASTADISGLKTGEYILNVIDANGCEDTDTAWINEPTELLISIDSIHDVSCYGYNNGFVNASATGGTPPYQFDLSGFSESGSNVNFNALPAGKYELILTDTNGCVVTDSVEVNEPDELIANIDTINSVQCYGSNNGSAHVSVVGGTGPFNYEWNTLPVQNTAWAVDLEPGTYSVIITDGNGCLAFDTVNITEPDPLVLTADSIDVRCGGKKPGSIDLHVSGGTPFTSEPYYRYEWQDTTGTVFATTEDVENLAGDQLYTVWVTDSLGCIKMHQVYINEIKNVELTAVVDSAKCYGDLWTIDVTATKGKQPYEFVWTDSTGVNVISNDEDMVDVPAGIYIVTVYDRDSCNETMNFVLEEPEELLAELYPDNDTICETEITGIQADPNGGTGVYTHLWTGTGAAFLDRTDTTDVYFGIAPPNDYQLIYTVIDENGCLFEDSLIVTVQSPTYSIEDTTLCEGEPAFAWNSQLIQTNRDSIYQDTLVNAEGCDSLLTLNVFISTPTYSIEDTTLCEGEPVFAWNSQLIQTNRDSIYQDTLVNAEGCDSLLTLNVFISTPTYSIEDTTLCEGEPAFAWNSQLIQTNRDSIYQDTLVNAEGCDSLLTLNVFISTPTYSIEDTTLCEGEPVFAWNSQLIQTNRDSIYQDTLVNAEGCDSLLTLNVFISTPTYSIEDTTLCEGEPVFAWNSQLIQTNRDSIYQDTLVNAEGCDSLLTLNVFISTPTYSIEDTTLCEGEPAFAWNSQLIQTNRDSIYQDTLVNAEGCDSLLTLNVFISTPTYSIEDTTLCEGEPAFAWNSQLIQTNRDSIYQDTLVNAEGCDSLLTLNVFISTPTYSIEDTTLCEGEPAFAWNSQLIQTNRDSIYQDTLVNAEGCDSLLTLNVFISTPTYSIEDTTLCEGEPAFAWNSQLIQTNRDSIYQDTLVNAEGCDSLLTLNVFISTPTYSIEDTTLCEGEPAFVWNSQLIQTNRDSIYQDTLVNAEGCDSLLTLNVFISTPTYSIEDTTLCEGEPAFAWNSQLIETNRDRVYQDTLVNAEGCDSLLTLNVFISTPTYSIEDTTLCEGEPAFAWNSQLIQTNRDSVYQDTLVNAEGCDSLLTLNVFISTPTYSIEDTTLCEGEPVFAWNSQLIQTNRDSIYQDTLVNAEGCDSLLTLNVFISTPTYSIEDTTLCEGEPVFAWNSQLIQTNRDSIYQDTLVNAEGCDSLLTLNVFISTPTYSIEDTTLCEGEPAFAWNSQLIETNRDSIYQDTLVNAEGCDSLLTLNVFISTPTYSIEDTTLCEGEPVFAWNSHLIQTNRDSIYQDTLVNAEGCDSLLTLNVFISTPTYSIEDTTLCEGEPVFAWNSQLIQTNRDSIYQDTLVNAEGCDSLLTLNVFISTPTYSIEDTTLCEGEPVFAWNSQLIQTNRDSIYQDTLVNAEGCDSLLTLNVFISTPTYSIEDTTLCEGEPAFAWNSQLIQTNRDSIYQDTLVNAEGCDSLLTLNVFISTPTYSIEDTTLCEGEPAFAWNSHLIQTNRDSIYLDTLVNAEGCDSLLTLNVFISTPTYSIEDTTLCEGEPAFAWNSQLIQTNRDSVYQDTLVNAEGCDSLLTLNVFISTPTYSIEDTTLCEGEPAFAWNSQLIQTNRDSIYQDTLVNAEGCYSLLTLNVFISTPTYSIEDTTLCEGEPAFAWNSQLIQTNRDSIYQDTLVNAEGCDSLLTLNVFISTPTYSIEDTTLCEGEPAFAWNSQLIQTNRDSIYQDTLVNAEGCDSLLTLNVFVSTPTYSIEDTTLCEGEPAFAWNSHLIQTNRDSIYQDTLVNAEGCDSLLTLNVFISTPTYSIEDTTLCEGEPAFAWNSQLIQTNRDSVYQDTLVNRYGCDSLLTMNVTINHGVFSEMAEVACDSFVWSLGNGQTYYTDTIVEYITLGSNGCSDTLKLNLTIYPSEIVSIIIDSDTTEVTEGDTVIFSATVENEGAAPIYAWFVNGVEVFGAHGDRFEYVPENGDTVFATLISDMDCSYPQPARSNVIQIIVNDLPADLTIIPRLLDILCYGDSTGNIELTVSGGSGSYLFSWTGPDGYTSSFQNISELPAGDYTVTVTDVIDNRATETQTVVVHQPDELDLTFTKTDVNGSPDPIGSIELTIQGGTPVYDISWTGPNGFSSRDEDLTGLEVGDYFVTVTDANNCVQILSVQIEGYGMSCPEPVVLECPDSELPVPYVSVTEYENSVGTIASTSSLIESTFTHTDVSDGNTCPEIITRTYSVENEDGDLISCSQTIIRNDVESPTVFIIPDKEYFTCNPDILPYQDLTELQTEGGATWVDNCKIVRMKYLSNYTIESDAICPKVIIRTYEIYDECDRSIRAEERITINDTTPPQITQFPRDINAVCEVPKPYASYSEFGFANGRVSDCNFVDTIIHVGDQPRAGDPYVIERTYRFIDVCGNFVDRIQLIYLPVKPVPVFVYGSFCEGTAPTSLNLVSDNGIRGSWSPDTIDTSVPGFFPYTFTSDSLECAEDTTIIIEIYERNSTSFDSIYPMCINTVPPALPDTSREGISGFWSPDTISTSVFGPSEYIFTPDADECALPYTLKVTIVDDIEPSFVLAERYCQFDSPDVLSTVSNEGFTGAWSPDTLRTDSVGTFTYVFTPDPGQCAVPTLHTVVIEEMLPSTLAPHGPYCQFDIVEALPLVSENGITGSWSPDEIRTDSAGIFTYVFTPDSGVCAYSDSILIEIIPEEVPAFILDTSYCVNSIPDILPSHSMNRIGGIWSPRVIETDSVGVFTYTFTPEPNQCAAVYVLTVHIVEKDIPEFSEFGPYCLNSNVSLPRRSNNGIPGRWLPATVSTAQIGTTTYTFTPIAECATPISVEIEVVDKIIPEFDTILPLCQYSIAPELLDTSLNGISGVWSPEAINTNIVGFSTYTFTPFAGQCALEYTVEVEVVDEVVAIFAAIGPLCQYSISPELPLTSINGVRGSWSPDTIQTDIVGTTNYTFTPDNQDCAKTTVITVEITPEIELSENHQNVEYSPEPIGSIDLNIEGGTAPFTIEWNGPNGFTASSEDMSGLFAGDYTVTVSDDVGCSAVLLVSITSQHPKLDCPPDAIFECPDPSIYPAFKDVNDFIVGGGYVEPLSAVTFFDSYDEVDPNGSYCLTILRTYIVGDSYGNLDSCTQRIEFYDNNPPLVVAPAGGSAECLSSFIPNIESLEDFLPYGTVSDNCAVDSASFAVDKRIVRSQNSSEVTYIFSIRDMCGNLGSDSAVYVLSDTIPPDAVCNSITVHLDSSGNYVLTDIDMANISAGSSDNCTAFDDLEINVTPSEFTCEDVESGRQVHVEVIDEAGNEGECWANIVVVDELPPVALCQDITVYLDAAGKADITVNMIDAGSYDNCELESVQISRDHFDCTDVGNNVVRLIATDAYGNVDSCEAVVTVIDEIPPYITCIPGDTIQLSEEDGTFALTWEYVTDSVWDECGIDTVILSEYLLDCNNIGQTTITATAYDINGNTNSCTTEFIVIGNTPPNVQNDSAITAVNIPIDINVVLNDYDLKTNINISTLGVTVGVRNGSVEVDNTTGIATYTPNPGYVGTDIFMYSICDDGIPCTPECGEAIVFVTVLPANLPPVAVDDYFDVPCINLSGNVAMNDYDPDLDDYVVDPVPITSTTNGTLVLYEDGHFEYEPFIDFTEGIDSFQYQIWDEPQVGPSLYDTAWVYITRVADNDCDGVADVDDIDDDNDGIRDNIENGGYWPEDPDVILIDSDQDGIPDYLDIDADNDGIVDNIEGQDEHNYIEPDGWRDDNNNGWDDRYDDEEGGYAFDLNLTDTDGDGIPDYLDSDSDNDNVPDYIEGSDDNADGIPDYVRFYSDLDRDGLDDAYDWVDGWGIPNLVDNETGSIAPLQDFDGDGWRDWRDVNDEDDEYLTRDEDINGNGDYSDDDLDLDGHPEYLDTEMECELFIPEGFSPNDDGVHDFFQILCIYPRYPDAKMMIFNRNGQLIWQKEKYGNYDYWGWNDAWWWGTSDNKFTLGRSGGLPAGNYIYVLELNDGRGTVHNGTVMIAY